MIRNIFYIFRLAPGIVCKSFLLELLLSLFVAVPTGSLLLIVRELFSAQVNEHRLWAYVIIIAVLLVVQLLFSGTTYVTSNRMTYTLSTHLRMKLGKHLQKLSMGAYKQRDPADLASVALQDVANFELIFVHTIGNIISTIFSTIIISVFLFVTDWRLGLILLVGLPLSWVVVKISGKFLLKEGAEHIRARNETGARFLEYVQGIRHIKSYGLTGKRFTVLEKAFNDFRKASIRTEAIPGPFVLTAAVIFELCFLWMAYTGITYFTGGTLTVAALITFLILGYRLYEPLKLALVDYTILRYMNISLARIVDLLNTPPQLSGTAGTPRQYDLQFDNVHFSYIEGKKVLDGVSFHIPEKSMLALVGPSGSGKTTITSLLARFHDVQGGSVKIGGTDVRNMQPEQVYSLISEVFQEVYLFDDTIYNNIRFGRMDATEEEILDAAEKAQVLDFAWEMPGGLQSRVGEGGNMLSGGQKQRVSIARALLKNAPVILLDEATASLDPENEIYIQKAIQELVKEKTVVVVAHKLATIRNADAILVLNEGKVEQWGRHEELVNCPGLYKRLWDIQQLAGGWKVEERTLSGSMSV
ncbi:ABC transporter ATP-binding protein [Chitinophaga tropicalis]|uniref:ATP-binding cassette domain-containing protein n=1 Tax=Chitinophaga tropicalis TaxID=2683588 RepID=A0A7K1U6B1_9BACT|nr:ABC transporter ATP-binding protein [Chitinophaga tropicalis]MVT09902.1 ATP-binding cassette domain-containing protein [Chitinophaga tropicalis]